MVSRRQETLLIDPGGRARIWCRTCGRELSDETSRSRRLGPECDPEPRHGYGRYDVDQEPIPGL
ncbi:hypothetical protein DMH12_15330 [Streptomyces sp. WAC 04229]|uniref:DUF6011 domain-containing protein n=1 Tax=Streptomyces sp. WAC 04229 TaxID=2203206 RepID=UPI000F73B692|nr:DUF6011 domain-containing protein [Streptomyces sp. WAC 04229]RSN55589.1 hypothetical protein DMH12_15330 [Streptomyces sp. WAC 04229]